MKYRVIYIFDDVQHVAVETDDIYIACLVADNLEAHSICDDVYIEKEKDV